MAEYIDRDAAIAACFDGFADCRDDCATNIRSIPAADVVERKAGTWCADYDGYSDGEPVYDMWWCSECGTYFDEWDDKPTWNFCPNCGADMRQRLKEGE